MPKKTVDINVLEIAMVETCFLNTGIRNNDWMEEEDPKDIVIDHKKAERQFEVYRRLVSWEAKLYLVPPMPNLQDQVYISNAFALLPHMSDGDNRTAILANFKAKGRPGEELIVKKFLEDLNFATFKPLHHFEGGAELKWVTRNIYIGGQGMRSHKFAYDWMEKKFGMVVVRVTETDKKLYHLDCSILPIDEQNVMVSVDTVAPNEVRAIEAVCNVVPVNKSDAYEGICNSVLLNKTCFNASRIAVLKSGTDDYKKEKHKNDTLEKICGKFGLEPIQFNIDEMEKSGASFSCCVAFMTPNGTMNNGKMKTMTTWSEPWIGKV